MATCLQVPMVVPSILRSSSSSSSTSSSFDMKPKIGLRNVNKRLNHRCSSSSNIPLGLIDPNDPFIQILAAQAKDDDEEELEPSSNSQLPPFLNLFHQQPSTQSSSSSSSSRRGSFSTRAYHDRVANSPLRRAPRGGRGPLKYTDGKYWSRTPPPDLASELHYARIIYIGMPLVDLVTELLIAQFLHLQYVDNKSPIYLYINSTGTTRDDNQIVAPEANGFAIYDMMNLVENDVETVCLGASDGLSCLLLASGKLGRRFMFPHSRISMKAPPVPDTGSRLTSDILRRAREAQLNRDMLFKLFALSTGHRLDDIKEKLKYPMYMGAKEALEFGVVDKILWQGHEDTLQEELDLTPEQWDKLIRGKSINDPSDP